MFHKVNNVTLEEVFSRLTECRYEPIQFSGVGYTKAEEIAGLYENEAKGSLG
jgi:hypothetical protein